jgi:hypothetical protein
MSGYLQRLSQSVMQPSQRVRPMGGSLFAPTVRESEAEPSLEFPQSGSAVELREKARGNGPLGVESREASAPQAKTQTPSAELSIHETREVSTEKERPTSPAPNAFRPLMPLVGVSPLASSQLTGNESARFPRKTETKQQQAREPDEIHIHIGRVEVLAVPQTTGPAAVKAPRKSSPSLDDYLRRRDRRTP